MVWMFGACIMRSRSSGPAMDDEGLRGSLGGTIVRGFSQLNQS